MRAGLLLALALAGCSATAPLPRSPDQALYDLHVGYVAGLTIITNYGKLPLCPGNTWVSGGHACANGQLLINANKASQSAAAALDLAQPAVDAWKAAKTGDSASKALSLIADAAREVGAVQAFEATINFH